MRNPIKILEDLQMRKEVKEAIKKELMVIELKKK